MIDTLLEDIDDITCKEYHRANKEYPAFASDHEGHDVFSEEVDEAEEELDKLKAADLAIKSAVRMNNEDMVANVAESSYRIACRLAAEAVQVAAMALKIQTSQKLRRSRNWKPDLWLDGVK